VDGVVIFDLDGTLIDTSGDIIHSANHVRELLGLEPASGREVLAAVGWGAPYLIARLTHGAPSDAPDVDQLVQTFRRHYLTHQTERSHPYPGIASALQTLGQRYHLYVLTNKPHDAALPELEGHGLAHYFENIWGAGALSADKPDPIGVRTALGQSGLSERQALIVGDMTPDIETGHNAGIKTVFVTWGFGKLTAQDPQPTITIEQVAQLPDAVRRILAK
jgi:phosphoglycolate phosphatase